MCLQVCSVYDDNIFLFFVNFTHDEIVSKACKVDPDDTVTLPVKFACKPEPTLTGLLG